MPKLKHGETRVRLAEDVQRLLDGVRIHSVAVVRSMVQLSARTEY